MKILQITAHYEPNLGGVETHLNDLVKGLIERKNKVFVLTYRPLTAKVKWKIWEKSNLLSIFRIPWIPGLFYRFVPYPILSFLYLLPGIFIFTPFVLIIFRPNVIHAHGLVAGFVGVFWGKIFRVRTVVSTHSLYSFPESGLYRHLVIWIFSNANHVSTLSLQALSEIRKLGIKKEKTSNFTYWIDTNKFKRVPNAKKLVKLGSKFVVIFVGRLVEEKGILVLLESFKNWNKEIYLAIAGTGPLEEFISETSKKHKNLMYLGKIDNSKLSLYYSASDILIVPSIHEEGFGRVIIESLACGTPVIGAERGAIPEAMNNEVGSLIKITKQNVTGIVNFYYNNPKYLKNRSIKAQKFARQRYTEANIDKILLTYFN